MTKEKRHIAQCFDLHALILGERSGLRIRGDDQFSPQGDGLQTFADSLTEYIWQLRQERDEARARIKVLERECDGLKLAIRRGE